MLRIGASRDIHRLEINNRPLVLGGVLIDSNLGPVSHSDGDCLLHAISEALLGALALGDLGTHFPDNDPKFKDYDSKLILQECYKMVEERGYHLVNLDTYIILEKPKLKQYIPQMREVIASILKVDVNKISIKAQTNEGLDSLGKIEAVECFATLLIEGE